MTDVLFSFPTIYILVLITANGVDATVPANLLEEAINKLNNVYK
jgi:hypothetical protein